MNTTMEDAVHDWIRIATGFAADNVLWGDQNFERPPLGPWISLNVIGSRKVGKDWKESTPNPTPSPGAERLITVRGVRVGTLSIQCFGGAATGTTTPRDYLERCVLALTLPSRARALNAANVVVADVEDVQSIGGVINSTRFEPRATLQATLHYNIETTETATYVENVSATGYIPNETSPEIEVEQFIPTLPSSGGGSMTLGGLTGAGAGVAPIVGAAAPTLGDLASAGTGTVGP
jgi:hypothetical protein